MNPGRTILTCRMGARIAPLCPGRAGDPGGTARDNRLFLEAILWPLP